MDLLCLFYLVFAMPLIRVCLYVPVHDLSKMRNIDVDESSDKKFDLQLAIMGVMDICT